jgi:hypothetical protein
MAQTLYKIVNDGQGSGGFLCPPGHPNHLYTVEGYYGGRVKPVNGPDLIAGLGYLIADEYHDVPPELRARARKIMRDAELTCSEAWVRYVYGYFRNSYSPDGVNRNVSDAISSSRLHCACGREFWREAELERHLDGTGPSHYKVTVPLPPAGHHLGYLCVREYFPEHEPRLDLIADPGDGYGAHPCAKCGQLVQYEARKDALCVVTSGSRWTYNADCPEGGNHE